MNDPIEMAIAKIQALEVEEMPERRTDEQV